MQLAEGKHEERTENMAQLCNLFCASIAVISREDKERVSKQIALCLIYAFSPSAAFLEPTCCTN
jgi:hypothetical protein